MSDYNKGNIKGNRYLKFWSEFEVSRKFRMDTLRDIQTHGLSVTVKMTDITSPYHIGLTRSVCLAQINKTTIITVKTELCVPMSILFNLF